MKLKTYVITLAKLMKKNPKIADYEVITSTDDEGNGFNLVYYEPTIGHYDKITGDFDPDDKSKFNSICVN